MQKNTANAPRQPEGQVVLEKERNSMTLELQKEQVAAKKAHPELAGAYATVRTEVKQMFALEPDSKLNAGNISAKVAVNDLQDLRLESVANDRAGAARTIIEKLNEIRNSSTESGRAEIRNGAMVVAALCVADKALAAEVSNAADLESNPYISAIIDQGHDLNAQQPAQTFQAQEPDMEL